MRILPSLVVLVLCAGCAGRELDPDATEPRIADNSHCPWSTGPSTTAQDCLFEPQRAFPRQDKRAKPVVPTVGSQPLEGLPH